MLAGLVIGLAAVLASAPIRNSDLGRRLAQGRDLAHGSFANAAPGLAVR